MSVSCASSKEAERSEIARLTKTTHVDGVLAAKESAILSPSTGRWVTAGSLLIRNTSAGVISCYVAHGQRLIKRKKTIGSADNIGKSGEPAKGYVLVIR